MFSNKLKKEMKEGKVKIGTFSICNSPEIIEIIALAGFDFVIIDTEHGPSSIESTQNLIRAAEAKGLTPIVRVTEHSSTTILRTLDIGAHGLQVPQVNDKETAEGIVANSKYYPLGNRGVALTRAGNYGAVNSVYDYFIKSNEETMIIVQCESKKGFENLKEIAKIPEIDVIFLGPFDMSQSLGIPGKVTSPEIEEISREVLKVAKENGKAAGIFATDSNQALKRIKEGYQYIALGMDVTLIYNSLRNEIEKMKY